MHKNLSGKIEQTEQLCFFPNVYINPGNCHEDLADIQFTATCPRSQIDVIVWRGNRTSFRPSYCSRPGGELNIHSAPW